MTLGPSRRPGAGAVNAVAAVLEENDGLRKRIASLEAQLVAFDAVLDGNMELVEKLAPGAFEVRRRESIRERERELLGSAADRLAEAVRSEVDSFGGLEEELDDTGRALVEALRTFLDVRKRYP